MNTIDLVKLIQWLFQNGDDSVCPYKFNSEEWYSLYVLALKHKIEALLYVQLCHQKTLLQTVPSPIRRTFRSIYQYNYNQNIYGLKEANRIAQACSETGVRICAERGIVLLNDVYPELAMRTIQDIDFLALRDDCLAIDCQLRSCGYEISRVNDQPSSYLPNRIAVNSVLYQKQGCVQDYDRQLTIDVIYHTNSVNLQQMIKRSKSPERGTCWGILQDEDLFLLLCCGLYDDALEHAPAPTVEHCSIGKVIDLIGYTRIHPVSLTSHLIQSSAVSYASSCAQAILNNSIFVVNGA